MYAFAILNLIALLLTSGEVLYFLGHDFIHPSRYGPWDILRHVAALAILTWLIAALVIGMPARQRAKRSGESVEIGSIEVRRTQDRLMIGQIGLGLSLMTCTMSVHCSMMNTFHHFKPDLLSALVCLCLAVFMMLDMFFWPAKYTWDRARNAFFYRRKLLCRLDEIAGVQAVSAPKGYVVNLTIPKASASEHITLRPVVDIKSDAETLARTIREFLDLTPVEHVPLVAK